MKTEIVALILALLAVVGVPAGVVYYDRVQQSGDVISLVAHRPLDGNWSQREIRAKLGERVKLRLTSEDVTHGFLIPDLGVNAGPISPGKYKTIEFTADRRGTFNFYCNILCSHEHGAMVGRIVVE